MLAEDEESLLLSLVLGRADGKTLSACCCVSKLWSGIARHEQFWKDLCCVRWPSSGDDTGVSTIVRAVGGYRKYYALRVQAQEHAWGPEERTLQRTHGMKDLIMFLDVVYDGTSICSFVKEAAELKPLFSPWIPGEDVFYFGLDIPELQFFPHSKTNTTFKGWKKNHIEHLTISWAVMQKSTHKMLQVLLVSEGDMFRNTCEFQDWLPGIAFSPIGTDYTAEVEIICQRMSDAAVGDGQQQQQCKKNGEHLMVLQRLNFGLMNRQTWSYFSQQEACYYLEKVFNHRM